MELLKDWTECQPRIGAVRRIGGAYTTNLYAPPDQIDRWCAAGKLSALAVDGAALFLLADRDFYHVYHVAEDQKALAAALSLLGAGTFSSDLLGQGDALDQVCATYAAEGFVDYKELRRMSRAWAPSEPSSEQSLVATPDDAEQVAIFLDRLLDPFAEKIPEVEELRSAAALGQLLVVRRGAAIAGMLLYDLKGHLAHLRFWHVDHDARGEGVGRRLMLSFLSRCSDARRLVLWVMGDNERSIAIYRHYGFAVDGLVDRIMVRRKEPHS